MSSSNAFMASRGSFNVLETIPLNQLHDASNPPQKKRKLSASNGLTAENIIIRAHAASLYDDPYVLEPVAVIPRLQFPFNWLDASSTLSQIQSGSLFEADIPALESDPQPELIVLVVRLTSDGGLYVIERVKRGIYSLSKLARGVEEGDVRVVVKASSQRVNGLAARTPRKQADGVSDGDWWRMAQVDDPVPDISLQIPAKRAKVDFVFGVSSEPVDRDGEMKGVSPMDSMERSSSYNVRMVSVPPEAQVPAEPVVSGEVDEGNICETTQSPQELMDGLREQYLQALYVSKASVAYFAKGPLARCRAAFQAPEPAPGNLSELVGFYRESILTAKKMDLKFRETLPTTLHDVVLSISDDEGAPKKRKSKKKTLGRNGLYAEEPDFIRGWWKNRTLTETGASAETSRDAEIKKHVSDLRMRETQLQILLILEAIALEAAAADEAKKTGQEETSSNATSHKPKPKTKKPQDLNVMLELHLDRLCIWHAVSFDDTPISDAQASGSAQQSGKVGGNDAMRDFCTEVIIPFYASRLPDRCKSITRKLGVSASIISPLPKSTKKPRKEPGAAERNSSQKSRRTLQRILTDGQSATQKPSLNRSITAPSLIESKRETTPLLPTLSASVRGGIQKAKRAENREVDLFAVARQHETKLKRVQMLADQKKELDAAIHALRKPNRELVAKDIAEDAERRSSSRKPKNPVRNPLGQGVQVMATPSKVRKRDAVVGLPPLPKSVARSKSKATTASSSSPHNAEPQIIPGSTIRPTSFSGAPFSADTAVQETPSRRPPQPPTSSKSTAEPSIAESPIPGTGNLFRVPRRPAPRPTETNPLTPVRSQHVDAIDDTPIDARQTRLPPPPPPLFALPSKVAPSNQSPMVFETPPKSKPGPPPMAGRLPSGSGSAPARAPGSSKPAAVVPVTPEKSIYAALGWDDDDDELAM
ncbi:DNA replication regulator SLD3-domain-containing protein [Aspergillus aurantiobrunneus]